MSYYHDNRVVVLNRRLRGEVGAPLLLKQRAPYCSAYETSPNRMVHVYYCLSSLSSSITACEVKILLEIRKPPRRRLGGGLDG